MKQKIYEKANNTEVERMRGNLILGGKGNFIKLFNKR